MITLTPINITSFPGARVVFTATRNGSLMALSTLQGAWVEVYFPGEGQQIATIHETNNTFSFVVPPSEGEIDAQVLISWGDQAEYADFHIRINPVLAARFSLQSNPGVDVTGQVHADIYNPLGQLVHSAPMTFNGLNYEISHTPGGDWFEGEYRVAVRDTTGVIDAKSIWIERPSLASMTSFFTLPPWQRQVIEYLKYEMMSDTEPLHPGALFTLEEYAKHWRMTVDEINHVPPYTMFHPEGIDLIWANVLLKGTTLRVFHSLANRAVTVPRWSNLDAPIQDESHLQQSWEARYQSLRPEYEEERAYMKGLYLPEPRITVDPFLGWIGGNLAGTSGLAIIGRPNWFSSTWGYR